jgi:cytochrome c-type biogenesis protein CcmH/NrfF
MIFIQLGFGYQPGLTWIPWVLPIILGTVAAAVVAMFLGRHRARHDTAKLTAALRL